LDHDPEKQMPAFGIMVYVFVPVAFVRRKCSRLSANCSSVVNLQVDADRLVFADHHLRRAR